MPSAGLDVFVASDPSHIPRINRQILTADPFLPLSPQTLTISKLWFGDQLWSVAGMNCGYFQSDRGLGDRFQARRPSIPRRFDNAMSSAWARIICESR